MNRLSIPTPGWLALNLMHGGETVGLCMLATAMLVSDDSDDIEISRAFNAISAAYDPLEDLRSFWAQQQADHPFLQGNIGPLVDWLDGAPESLNRTVQRCAATLGGVSISGADEQADHDLLARVLQSMRECQAGTMTSGQWKFVTQEQQMLKTALGLDDVYVPYEKVGKKGRKTRGWRRAETLEERLPREGTTFRDQWAGSGVRAVTLARMMRALGLDPTKVTWSLQEADGMMLAIAGVNMVAWEMGEHIELIHDDTYQVAAQAAYAATRDLPPAVLLAPQW